LAQLSPNNGSSLGDLVSNVLHRLDALNNHTDQPLHYEDITPLPGQDPIDQQLSNIGDKFNDTIHQLLANENGNFMPPLHLMNAIEDLLPNVTNIFPPPPPQQQPGNPPMSDGTNPMPPIPPNQIIFNSVDTNELPTQIMPSVTAIINLVQG
jgi:hypothetical protein